MENKINIAELLKDCPKGMELDCLLYNNVTFLSIDDDRHTIFPIKLLRSDGCELRFTKYGQYANMDDAKCVIFPKNKTTWEGFVPPCEFKDGDIVATSSGGWICITTGGKSGEFMPTYCVIKGDGEFEVYFNKKEMWQFHRLATKEEKAKLFQTIKDNGYKWNAETKTLEKLVNPRFKIGDRIRSKISLFEYTIIDVTKDSYIVRYKTDKFYHHVSFCNENNYDLIPNKFDITTLKPFDKVLVRDSCNETWECGIYSHYKRGDAYPYKCVHKGLYSKCIPYEGNEHLLDTNNDCDEYYKNW